MPPDNIEVVSWQVQIKCLHKRTGCKFGCHKYIAENTDALSRNYRLDRVQLLAKAEMLHILEIGQIAPLASGDG